MVIARVPQASGFFAQGDTFEEARANLRDVIEGNVLLALQLGLELPRIEGGRDRGASSCPHRPKAWQSSRLLSLGISREDWLKL
jgi:hypothetical protein